MINRCPNILVVNDNYLGYGTAVSSALSKRGSLAGSLFFSNRSFFFKFAKPILERYRFFRLLKTLKANPDCTGLLFLVGNIPFPFRWLADIQEAFPGLICVAWFYDKIEKYSDPSLGFFDVVYCFDERDVVESRDAGVSAHLLPLFYDDNVYVYSRDKQRTIDFAFVGAWTGRQYSKRRAILCQVAHYCRLHKKQLRVVGPYGLSKPVQYLRDLFYARGFRCFVSSGPYDHKEIAELYSQSKVVINIGGDRQNTSIPMRFYEALSSGCSLINDSSEAASAECDRLNLDNVVFAESEVPYGILEDLLANNLPCTDLNFSDNSLSARIDKILCHLRRKRGCDEKGDMGNE